MERARRRGGGVKDIVWPVCLLWPRPDAQHARMRLNAATIADLGLEHIVQALDVDRQHAGVIRAILCEPSTEPDVIAYRQEILADLLSLPALADALQALLPELAALTPSRT